MEDLQFQLEEEVLSKEDIMVGASYLVYSIVSVYFCYLLYFGSVHHSAVWHFVY